MKGVKIRQFKTQKALDNFRIKNKNRYLMQEVFINNAYGVEYKPLLKVYWKTMYAIINIIPQFKLIKSGFKTKKEAKKHIKNLENDKTSSLITILKVYEVDLY